MIEVKNLCFGYIKQPLCLKDLSFTLIGGQTLGLFGGEGMGKTSLLRLLCGLEKQYAGSIKIDGKTVEIGKINCSFLPSEPVLFLNKSLKENLDYLFKVQQVALVSDEKIIEVFEKFNFKNDLKTKAKKLSLKDKRIFAMIRSYLKNSDFLLIDDQTDGLNDEEIEDIKNAIFTLIYVKNTTKTAILAFNNKKSVIETDKKIYLSFTKWFDINSINDFYDKDIFAFNYVNCSSRDFVLKRSGGYYLFDYEIAQNKKKKQTILKSQYKLNSKYDFNLEEGDQIFVKICSKDNIDLTNINDDKIDKLLSQSKAHIFDAVCGDKLI